MSCGSHGRSRESERTVGRGRTEVCAAGAVGRATGSSHGETRGRRDDAGGGRSVVGVSIVGDTELRRILVGAVGAGEFDTVVGGIGLERGGNGPVVGTGILDGVDDGLEVDAVGRGTAEEDERDVAVGRRVPSDGVGFTGGHKVVETWESDGIA